MSINLLINLAAARRSLSVLQIFILALPALFCGCANVTFHSDPALTQKTGLKFYYAKPYLLVSYTGAKDNPVKVDIISLPDLEHPTYALYHPGWGTHNFTLAQNTNGTISSYGQTTDSKGPETINALAGLLTSATGGVGAVANAIGTLRKESGKLDAVTLAVRDAITAVQWISNKPVAEVKPFEQKQTQAVAIVKELGAVLNALAAGDSNQQAALERISSEIEAAKIPAPGDVAIAQSINDSFDQAKQAIDRALKALSESGGKPAEKADFKLFEIRMEGGITKLIPVNAATSRKLIQKTTGIFK